MHGELPKGWDAAIPDFPADAKGLATRAASGKILNAIAPKLPTLIGGSADLNPSTFTVLQNRGDFESPQRDFTHSQGSSGGGYSYAGRNLHFGVREHGMAASLNGMAAHGGIIPFRLDVPDVLRLYASSDSARGADGAGGDLRLHPR
jgi:transketolase